jgi:hypothetical protein
MIMNRREFVTSSAAILASTGLVSPSGATIQSPRKLILMIRGLSILAVRRPANAKGLPSSSSRVELLFVKSDEHFPPKLWVDGMALDLGGCDLRITVDGKPLPSSAPVAISLQSNTTGCPVTGEDWSSMSWLPDLERVVDGRMLMKAACLDPKAPEMISGRFIMQGGTLSGDTPRKYLGTKWIFPNGNASYVQAFTDIYTWLIDLPSGDVAFEAIEFGKTDAKATIKPNLAPGSVTSYSLESERKRADQAAIGEDSIPHFVHYYDLVQFNGTTRPIPTKHPSNSCNPAVPTTVDQRLRLERQINLKLQFQRPSGPQQNDDSQSACGLNDSSETVMRGEPGICVPAIAYVE